MPTWNRARLVRESRILSSWGEPPRAASNIRYTKGPAQTDLELDGLRVAPEAFEVVILAGFFGKYVNQEVAVIEQHPFGVLVAFDALWALAQFAELRFDLVGDRLDLPGVRAATDDEKVGEGSDFAKI